MGSKHTILLGSHFHVTELIKSSASHRSYMSGAFVQWLDVGPWVRGFLPPPAEPEKWGSPNQKGSIMLQAPEGERLIN